MIDSHSTQNNFQPLYVLYGWVSELHERTKLHGDKITRRQNCTRGQNCTTTKFHGNKIARGDNFARKLFFFYNNFFFIVFFS